jgi:hypothetical protein
VLYLRVGDNSIVPQVGEPYKVHHSLRVRTQLIDQISSSGLLHSNRVCVLEVLSLSQLLLMVGDRHTI